MTNLTSGCPITCNEIVIWMLNQNLCFSLQHLIRSLSELEARISINLNLATTSKCLLVSVPLATKPLLTKSHLICGFPIIITTASILNPGFMLRLPIELLPLCPKSWLLLTTIVFSVQKSLSRVVYGGEQGELIESIVAWSCDYLSCLYTSTTAAKYCLLPDATFSTSSTNHITTLYRITRTITTIIPTSIFFIILFIPLVLAVLLLCTTTTTPTTGTTSCLIQLVWLLSLQVPWDLQWGHIVYLPIMPSTVRTHLQQLWESEQDQTGLDRSARWSEQWWSRGGPTGP